MVSILFTATRLISLDRRASLAMKESLLIRSENVVPKPRGDAEALVMGLEVVCHMVAAQLHEVLPLKTKMVQRVVGHVVNNIPQHKPSENAVNIIRQPEQ